MILLQCLIYHITSTIGIIFSINQSINVISNKKKKKFYSLALSKKLSLIHGNFLTYQDVLHVAHDLFGSPRSFLFTYIFFLKYIESYNHLDIKMKFHHMIRLMAFPCLKWTVAQSPNATIAVIVTNRFRLEQKSYLPLKFQFMSRFR
jgi:hypothetical protein